MKATDVVFMLLSRYWLSKPLDTIRCWGIMFSVHVRVQRKFVSTVFHKPLRRLATFTIVVHWEQIWTD